MVKINFQEAAKELCSAPTEDQIEDSWEGDLASTTNILYSQFILQLILGIIALTLNTFLVYDVYNTFGSRRSGITQSSAHNIYILQIGLTDGTSAFLRIFIAGMVNYENKIIKSVSNQNSTVYKVVITTTLAYNLSNTRFGTTDWDLFGSVQLYNWVLADFNYMVYI